jgi:glutamate synthase domain-containing protein 1
MAYRRRPERYGLYEPAFEKDGCGVGFVANIKGVRSHEIVEDAKKVLINMTHRGAVGSEKNTGDGAGILTALPYEFLEKVAKERRFSLPERGSYGAGIVFLSDDAGEKIEQKRRFEEIGEGLGLPSSAGSRSTGHSMIGPSASRANRHEMASSLWDEMASTHRTKALRVQETGYQEIGRWHRQGFLLLHLQPFVEDHRVQGHCHARTFSVFPTSRDKDYKIHSP